MVRAARLCVYVSMLLRISAEFLGQVRFSLSEIQRRVRIAGWFELMDEKVLM